MNEQGRESDSAERLVRFLPGLITVELCMEAALAAGRRGEKNANWRSTICISKSWFYTFRAASAGNLGFLEITTTFFTVGMEQSPTRS